MHESPDAPQETRVRAGERADALAARAQRRFWDSRCLDLPGAEVTPNAPSIVAGFRPGRPIEGRERSACSLPLEICGNRPKLARGSSVGAGVAVLSGRVFSWGWFVGVGSHLNTRNHQIVEFQSLMRRRKFENVHSNWENRVMMYI